MIQRINNISNNPSFKGIYPVAGIETITLKNMSKLEPVINMSDSFPLNDIFLGKTNKNELTIEVRKKEQLVELLYPEVANALDDVSDQDLSDFAGYLVMLKEAFYENHPEMVLKTKTKDMNKMSAVEIAQVIADAVFKFNKAHDNKPN